MEVKLIKTKDFYDTMQQWWIGNEEAIVSPAALPEHTLVCYNNKGIPTYSMCFYNTDSNLCWIGWQLVNPDVNREDKKGCFSYLFKEAEKYAKELGYSIMFTTSHTPSVIRTLEQQEYSVGDINVNHYLKII